MNKKIIWLLGQQQSGKTTLSNMFRMYGVQTLNIGERLRRNVEIKQFVDSENPFAPKFVESEVQGMINSAIYELFNSSSSLLIVDSAPRNPEQYNIVLSHAKISTIVLIKQPLEVRRNRAILKYDGDLTYFNSRERHESEWLDFVMMKSNLNEINTIEMGTD